MILSILIYHSEKVINFRQGRNSDGDWPKANVSPSSFF